MARKALGPAALAVVQAVEASLDAWADLGAAPVLVACSGGADSLALALAAGVVAARRGTQVRALVVDHGLQSGSAEAAARVVEQLEGRGVPGVVLTAVVARGAGDGLEAAAREARYAVLADAAGAAPVLLGHTLDDQAEQVLLGLARGSGTRSLAGMPARRTVGRTLFVRTLLGVRRATTAQACAEWGVEPWRGPHNADLAFTRVRVRSRVLPVLEDALGPGVAEALARTASLARDDANLLDDLADQALDGAQAEGGLSCTDLVAMPPALRRRVLPRWLIDAGCPEPTWTHVLAVDALVLDWRGQKGVDVPGLRVMRREGHLVAGS